MIHQKQTIFDENSVLTLGSIIYYDGNTKFDFIKSGLDSAAEIIKTIKPSNGNGNMKT